MKDKKNSLILLERTLRFMAIAVLKKYQPQIVGITGSVGKTSCKEAVGLVLSKKFNVRQNEKNYNNEIGLPLTVIGAESGKRSIFGWFKVFFIWLSEIIWRKKDYPEILVLEMGADRPGDIKYLTDFIKPKIGIITDVSGSHLEFFKTLDGVAKEKGVLVRSLKDDGLAILNFDNPYSLKMKENLSSKVLTFGFSEGADLQASGEIFNYDNEDGNIMGLSFKLNYKGANMPVRLNNILARHQIYPALAAVAAGLELGMNLVEISEALQNFIPPVGRMNLIAGIKNSWIIDDTYNSSPASAALAISTLGKIKSKRKIAVLGDMLELGPGMEEGHRGLAKNILENEIDLVLAVGKRMKFAVEVLKKGKFSPENIFVFDNSLQAGKKLQEIILPDDAILVKGSQGMRMEKVVEEVMAHPEKAEKVLCRQNAEWKAKPVNEV